MRQPRASWSRIPRAAETSAWSARKTMTSVFASPAVSEITSGAILPLAAKEAAGGNRIRNATESARKATRPPPYPTDAGGRKAEALRLVENEIEAVGEELGHGAA